MSSFSCNIVLQLFFYYNNFAETYVLHRKQLQLWKMLNSLHHLLILLSRQWVNMLKNILRLYILFHGMMTGILLATTGALVG
ncbi:TPA: hypothetical protein I4G32_12280 [Enterobacter hormaechei subsp. oharae]|nr:hypothetical protein ASV12_01320 [Enterobacter hormaechei subsp. xiangfangensis]KTI87169.1 hypothetical protein ASU94_15975 [Enterobacter hormaechei subsp. xiangfangensis]HAS1740329.1 hypothetical protein [Enterobacter hormaechei subsp. oharae]HAS1750633.1 hypothetical protein [Enterobacter hormaechei subsp. oharae]